MAFTIDHLVVPAHDHEASARFFAQIMGCAYDGPLRHFAPVHTSATFTVMFLQVDHFTPYHFAFQASDDDIMAIAERLDAAGVAYGNDPRDTTNGRTDHPFGGRGLFFLDPNRHLIEVMTIVRPH
jgi:extradiol dioxygenase family protein